ARGRPFLDFFFADVLFAGFFSTGFFFGDFFLAVFFLTRRRIFIRASIKSSTASCFLALRLIHTRESRRLSTASCFFAMQYSTSGRAVRAPGTRPAPASQGAARLEGRARFGPAPQHRLLLERRLVGGDDLG